eukprot:14162470-Alexandrium_andersonii.AAC.1
MPEGAGARAHTHTRTHKRDRAHGPPPCLLAEAEHPGAPRSVVQDRRRPTGRPFEGSSDSP